MNKSFTFRSLLVVAAVSGVIEGTASAACWYPDEIVADQVKDFQYMLMVGALQCRNNYSQAGESYNAFVAQQRNVLDSKGYVLKGHFLRENGVSGGREAYDKYNTAMSNRHASRMDEPSFCQTIAAYTRLAATSSDRDFITLAQAVIEAPVSTCLPAGYVAPVVAPPPVARRPEPLPPVAVADADDPYAGEVIAARVDPAVYAPPPPAALPAAPEPVVAPPVAVAPAVEARPAAAVVPAVAYVPPPAPPEPVAPPVAYAAPPRAAAIPTKVIAAAPVIPPEEARAAPSPAAALQAAIVALQAAAEALKAQSGPTS